ncbi:hypothetical protein GOP47_0013932 [Adiantum capillus-veneris]|uniref:CS domain-containing protein n=1 Tax=Adiantum capillus-veneris TaxID=13818 RepID=A0A9D4ZG90_ADICA|nr:hypothetical protein GOP47_0013932 [Adiantum capillus-veneris]
MDILDLWQLGAYAMDTGSFVMKLPLAFHPSSSPSPSPSPSAFASSFEPSTSNYEFRDDKGEVELRVNLPEGKNIGASNVFVDAQDTNISVTLALSSSLLNVLPPTRLYGRIKASETVWFVDEEEIVISLKKLNKEIVWPGLVEDWGTLTKGVANLLKGIPVYLVGESSDINWAVAQKLAEGLHYVPLQTGQLLEKAAKKSLETMITEEGIDAVADAESMILSSLNSHVRLVVGTLGGHHGAASRSRKWNHLHAGVTVWLSLSTATDEESAEEEAKKARQEGSNAYSNAEAIVALSAWEEGAAQPVAEGCLRALKYLLESDKELAGKKNLYVRLGCRGDWPNIMPPGWDPSSKSSTTLAP